jgi:hypothetical protein
MKHKITIEFIATTLISLMLSAALTGQEKKDSAISCREPDSLIPSNAEIFIKVEKISKAFDFINSGKYSYNLADLILKKVKWIKLLKDKTNIDLLNTRSLKDIGIDADRSLYITGFGYDKNETDSVIFLPVIDKKNFPSNFVKFLKLINDDKSGPDLNPALSTYKGVKVYQVPNKIFFAVIEEYFVLTSSGGILSNIIDMKMNL